MSTSGNADAYTAFSEGMRLLSDGNAHAAVIALERARELEPAKSSVREALARAYFRTGRFAAAEDEFNATLDIEPVNGRELAGISGLRRRCVPTMPITGPPSNKSQTLRRPARQTRERASVSDQA
jgi:tetratricopeptide (TPR) repeat protein